MELKRAGTGFLSAAILLLMGCFGEGETDFPSIKKAELVGCWVKYAPAFSAMCEEECYSGSNKVYFKTLYKATQDNNGGYSEFAGTYTIDGGTQLGISISGMNNVDIGVVNSSFKADFTIIRDTLNSIGKGSALDPFTRSDLTHNCGPHWLLFPEPADWELP